MPASDRTSDPTLDDLDAGWGEEDEAEELEAPESELPDLPGLTPEEREARIEARKERAKAKAVAKKERRKARALAAAGKKKPKQKRTGRREGPIAERSAPSLRGVSKDTDAREASGDPIPATGDESSSLDRRSPGSQGGQPQTRGSRSLSRSPQGQGGLSRATLLAIAALVIVLGAVAFYVFRK